jgi:hypothetical protein
MLTSHPLVIRELGSAQRVGLGRIPERKANARSQVIPLSDPCSEPQDPPGTPQHHSPSTIFHPHYPKVASCPVDEKEYLETHSSVCIQVLEFRFSPGREFPVRGFLLKPEQALSSPKPPESLGSPDGPGPVCGVGSLPE